MKASKFPSGKFFPKLAILLVLFIFIQHHANGQGEKWQPEFVFGWSFAKQQWIPYGASSLAIKGKPVKFPMLSFSVLNELTNNLVWSYGVGIKRKGVSSIKTRDLPPDYFYGYPIKYQYISYYMATLSAHSTLRYYIKGPPNGGLYIGSGLGLDYLVSKKLPQVHTAFPYDVAVYFDDRDYRRLAAYLTLTGGFALGEQVYIGFEYAPFFTKSMKVRQMHIKDSFFMFGLVLILDYAEQE